MTKYGRIGVLLFCVLGALWMERGAAAGAGATAEGRVSLSPARVRVQAGDTISFDVLLDFSDNPTFGGGISITWDPSILSATGWTYASSTIDDDPALRGTPAFFPGLLKGVSVGSPSGLRTAGVMGTITFTALAKICDTAIGIEQGAEPWVSIVTQSELSPVFGGARAGVGEDICIEAPINPADAQMRGRCIGIVDVAGGDGCPTLTGWRERPAFEPLTVRQDLGIVQPLANHMAKYCVYQRVGFDDGNPADCGELQAAADRAGHGIDLDPAVMAAGVQGVLDDILSPDLEANFQTQVGKPLGDLPSPSPGAQLWIISLDTSSRQRDDPLASHGPVIDRIINQLTPIATAAEFNTLALPFTCFDEQDCLSLCGLPDGCPAPLDFGDGGFMGTPESVAAGLHAGIALWSEDGGAIRRLVFNASLGWPAEFNDIDGTPTIGYLAFVDALKEAACLGALVIASAGNAGTGPVPAQGLLFPGAESLVAAPTPEECANLGYLPDPDNFPDAGDSRPLVYAVGANRSDGSPLIARLDAEPELVAFGDHATALTTFGEAVLTGSSVSSAVASATAGLIWAYDLEVAPHDIMETIYGAGDDLGRDAQACLGGPPCRGVRRISMCQSLLALCEGGSPDCPTPAEIDCPDIDPTQLTLPEQVFDELETAFAGARTISVAGYTTGEGSDYDAVCNATGDYKLYQDSAEGPPLYPCPQDQFFDIQAQVWAKGQPEGQNCPTCGAFQRSPAKLYVEIRDDFGTEFADPTLSDATLVCRAANGSATAFRLPGTYTPGELVLVTDIDDGLCPGEDLTLAFTVADEAGNPPVAFVQPLFVVRPDLDLDQVPDFRDNCTEQVNSDQRDTNGDGYGNRCDPDLDNDGNVNFIDLGAMKGVFFSTDADADLNGDGFVNFLDLSIMKALFFGPPGPSSLAP